MWRGGGFKDQRNCRCAQLDCVGVLAAEHFQIIEACDAGARALRSCISVFSEPNRALALLPAAFHTHYIPGHLVADRCHNSSKQDFDRSYCMDCLAA